MMADAEVGVTSLEARECQGLLLATGSKQKGKELVLQNLQREEQGRKAGVKMGRRRGLGPGRLPSVRAPDVLVPLRIWPEVPEEPPASWHDTPIPKPPFFERASAPHSLAPW